MSDTFVLGTSTKQQATSYLKALEDITHQGGHIGQGTANRSEINPTLRIAQPVETVVHDRPNGVFTLKAYTDSYIPDSETNELSTVTYGIKVVNDAITGTIENQDGEYCGQINLWNVPVRTAYFPCVTYVFEDSYNYTVREGIMPKQEYVIYLKTDVETVGTSQSTADALVKTSIVIAPADSGMARDTATTDYIVLGNFHYYYASGTDYPPLFEVQQVYTAGKAADVTEGRWWY